MGITPSSTLQQILPAAKIRHTLDLYLANGDVVRLSRGKVVRIISGSPVEYQNYIRSVGDLKHSLETSIDRLTITAQNVNSELGFDLASELRLLDYAYAEYGKIYQSIRDESLIEDIQTIFRGVLANVEASETSVEYEIIVDYDSMGSILASRACGYLCPWAYKNGIECTSTSSLPDCPKTRAACRERGKEWEHGGCEPFEQPVSTPPAGDGSGIGSGIGNGGGGGFDNTRDDGTPFNPVYYGVY